MSHVFYFALSALSLLLALLMVVLMSSDSNLNSYLYSFPFGFLSAVLGFVGASKVLESKSNPENGHIDSSEESDYKITK